LFGLTWKEVRFTTKELAATDVRPGLYKASDINAKPATTTIFANVALEIEKRSMAANMTCFWSCLYETHTPYAIKNWIAPATPRLQRALEEEDNKGEESRSGITEEARG
jgi:hypothetical protein